MPSIPYETYRCFTGQVFHGVNHEPLSVMPLGQTRGSTVLCQKTFNFQLFTFNSPPLHSPPPPLGGWGAVFGIRKSELETRKKKIDEAGASSAPGCRNSEIDGERIHCTLLLRKIILFTSIYYTTKDCGIIIHAALY